MKTLFTILSVGLTMLAQAQLMKQDHMIILYSGDIITGERLVYESPIMKQPTFTLESESYESNTVGFFQNNHGYFANLSRLHGTNAERYAIRIKTAKMNLYEEVDLTVYGGDDLQLEDSSILQNPMLATGEMYEYYSMGDEPVREATYSNLIVDLGENEGSVKHLHSFRNYRLLQWGMIGIGSGIIAANILAQSHSAVRFNPVMALGIVIGGGSYFMQAPKQDELWLAADEYNSKHEEVLSER